MMGVVGLLVLCSLVGYAEEKIVRLEDPGCCLTYESHGCNCGSRSCVCKEKVTYERYGQPGDIPLHIQVSAGAWCEVWVAYWPYRIDCEDTETKTGHGTVTVEAQCVIYTTEDCALWAFGYECNEL